MSAGMLNTISAVVPDCMTCPSTMVSNFKFATEMASSVTMKEPMGQLLSTFFPSAH